MRIHHIGCGTMSPYGGRFVDGFSHGFTAKLVCHCWLIETESGLVLVDTGLGVEDVHYPLPRLSKTLLRANRVQLSESSTALEQVRRRGFDPADVRHILLTHLDFDCAGGLNDFPNAQVHVLAREFEQAMHPRTWLEKQRYRSAQWSREHNWNTYVPEGERWFGMPAIGGLKGLPPEIFFVPLAGHTWGHAGVAVQTAGGWMLHAGDAYFYRQELEPEHYRCPPGLRVYQWCMETNRELRRATLGHLRRLVEEHSHEVRVCSSHDAIELVAYQAQQLPLREQFEVRTLSPHPS